MTRPGSHLSLCIVSWGTEKGQGVGSSCKTSKPAPPPCHISSSQVPLSGFYDLPKECHPLESKCSKHPSLWGCFVLKPQQSEDRKPGLWDQGLGSVSCEQNELRPPQCCDVSSPKQQGQSAIETVGEKQPSLL